MSLIDNLAAIRELQGKEPLPNPHMIQGFEPTDPTVPPYNPYDAAGIRDPLPEDFGQSADPFGLDDTPPAVPASPLIPRKAPVRTPAGDALPAPITGPVFSLMVADHIGSWKGREVQLSEKEEKAVRAVVLKAIQRELQADLSEAGVRRARKPKDAILADPPKRRGRPRKVQP